MIRFAGYSCLDPVSMRRDLLRQDPPVGVDHWWGKANVYRTSLGLESARATVLMLQCDLEALDTANRIDSPHPLEFSDGTNPPAKIKDLYVESYRRIYPAAEDDWSSAVLVELVDKRHLLKRIPVDMRFNVYECPCGTVLEDTQNGGVDWTWNGMVGELWESCPAMGAYPGLNWEPDGTPYNFVFEGQTLFEALTHVFARLSMAPFYDPFKGTWQLIRLGRETDTVRAANAVKLWTTKGLKVWDDFTRVTTRTKYPEKVRVCFWKQPLPNDGTAHVYSIDVEPTSPLDGTAETGTVQILWDDLPAIYCDSENETDDPDNLEDLEARADERASDYYRVMDGVRNPSLRGFKGIRTDAYLGLYGGSAMTLALEDRGGGYKFELRGGELPKGMGGEEWRPYRPSAGCASTFTVYSYACIDGDHIEYESTVTIDWNAKTLTQTAYS